MKMMLYSYCRIFNINPMEAKDTPISRMLEMLQIQGEVESFKNEEIERQAMKK